RLIATPDTEARVPGLPEVDRDSEAAVADVWVPLEVLHDLRPLSFAAVRAEAELVLNRSTASSAPTHRSRSMPRRALGQADRPPHRLDWRLAARPQLEARSPLRHEHLEPVEDSSARSGRGFRCRRRWIWEIDQRLPRPELEQHLVPH